MTGFAAAAIAVADAVRARGEDPAEGPTDPSARPDGAADGQVEIRSVNGRFLDVALKLPDELRSLEPAIRQALAAQLRRGKVEVRIALARESGRDALQPSPERLMRLARAEATVRGWLPDARALSVHEALQWMREAEATPAAQLEPRAMAAANRAIDGLRAARAREGARLADVLRERLAEIRSLAQDAAPLVPAAAERQRVRFLERWQQAVEAVAASPTPASAAAGKPAALPPVVAPQALEERALAELAAQALRSDIGEELARLATHADEIERVLHEGGEVGRKLDFLIQELHREANTLGSKSPSIELTRIAVAMKVAIEQMREQVQNLE